MASPRHGYGPTSPRGSDRSFGRSERYGDNFDDLADRFSDTHLHDRSASRAASSRTSSSNHSSSSKGYVFYRFAKGDDDWYNARRDEINASEEDIRKRSKNRNKAGSALEQLEKMGEGRRQQITRLQTELDRSEADGSSWQPIFIETTKVTRGRDGTLKPSEFNVILARRTPKPEPQPRRPSRVEKPSNARAVTSHTPVTQTKLKPIIHDAKKGKRSGSDNHLDDPFNNTRLFSPQGHPMNADGPIPFIGTTPSHLPQEKPLAQHMLPKIDTQQAPAIGGGKNVRIQPQIIDRDPLDLDALLDGNVHDGDADAVIDVGEVHAPNNTRHASHSQQRPKQRPGPRRYSSAQRSSNDGRYGNVIVENRHPDQYTSSRSSWASDDGSVVWGEVDEVSSKTSDDTHYSGHRSPIRKPYGATDHDRRPSGTYSPLSPRYRNGDTLAVPERRRRPTPIDTQRPYGVVAEQLSPNRNLARPAIHQQARPQAQSTQRVPPTAEYPSYYSERPHRESYQTEDHIREAQREEARRVREAEIAQREYDLDRLAREFNDLGNQPSRQANIVTGGRKRYTFEPRNLF